MDLIYLQRSLVTVQFALSIGLITATMIMLQQTKYMTSRYPGFNKENVVIVDALQRNSKKIFPLFKQRLDNNPGIAGVSAAGAGLGEGTEIMQRGFKVNGEQKRVYEYLVDTSYIGVMGMQLIAGRNFDNRIATDTTNAVIINEAAVTDLGWTLDNVIGQPIKGYSNTQAPIVIGVVKNFNYQPLKEIVKPQLFHSFAKGNPRKFIVRIKPGDVSGALASIKTAWDELVPDAPFRYVFLDENLDNLYKAEQRWSSVVGWAGAISVFLASLGLLGLSALASVNRSREVAIRKVFGASIPDILNIMTKDFLKLVLIALLIAAPVSWYFMHGWLQNYAYTINISLWVFVVTGLSVLLLALITTGCYSLKLAFVAPAKTLKRD